MKRPIYLAMLVFLLAMLFFLLAFAFASCDDGSSNSTRDSGKTVAMELEGINTLVFTLEGDWEWKSPAGLYSDLTAELCIVGGVVNLASWTYAGVIQEDNKVLKLTLTRGFSTAPSGYSTTNFMLKKSADTEGLKDFVTKTSPQETWTAVADKIGPFFITAQQPQ